MRKYWLFKTEPNVFSIDNLKNEKVSMWEGIRNYQARNFLRDTVAVGDGVIIYHSNAKPPGAVGIGKIVRDSYPDHTAFDSKATYYDAKSDPENPRWFMVDVAYESTFKRMVSLPEIKEHPALQEMLLNKRSRLSIQPVDKADYDRVIALGASNKPVQMKATP